MRNKARVSPREYERSTKNLLFEREFYAGLRISLPEGFVWNATAAAGRKRNTDFAVTQVLRELRCNAFFGCCTVLIGEGKLTIADVVEVTTRA
jgi:hypothetical protein